VAGRHDGLKKQTIAVDKNNEDQGRREWVRASCKDAPAKNIYNKLEKLTLSCRGTWAWSERIDLYIRRKMILPRSTKTWAT